MEHIFEYELPEGGLTASAFYDDSGQIKFDPPVYQQRYTSVCRILADLKWRESFKKVVEFGCAEMRLLMMLRRIEHIEHIIQVDIDHALLEGNKERAQPLLSDHLNLRPTPLKIDVYSGSVITPAEQLRRTDVVIAIELIEHLDADILEQVPANIFGFMQPKMAIFTTPNGEVNVMFDKLLPNGFRHDDHRFEWTRDEFRRWCFGICDKYPNYKVAIMGLGVVPQEHAHLGTISQMAIFTRRDLLGLPLVHELKGPRCPSPVLQPDQEYKLIASVEFPHDKRSTNDKILDEAKYYMNCNFEQYLRPDKDDVAYLPLSKMYNFAADLNVSQNEVRQLLQANRIELDGEFIVVPREEEYDEDEHMEYSDEPLSNDAHSDYCYRGENAENEPPEEENWD